MKSLQSDFLPQKQNIVGLPYSTWTRNKGEVTNLRIRNSLEMESGETTHNPQTTKHLKEEMQ